MTIGKFVEDCRAKGIDCSYEGTKKLFASAKPEFEEVDAHVAEVFVRDADSVIQYDVVKKNKNNAKQKRSLEFDFDEGVWRVLDGEKIKKEFVFAEIKDINRGATDPRQIEVHFGPPEHLPVDQQVNWKIQRPYSLACESSMQASEIVESLALAKLLARSHMLEEAQEDEEDAQ